MLRQQGLHAWIVRATYTRCVQKIEAAIAEEVQSRHITDHHLRVFEAYLLDLSTSEIRFSNRHFPLRPPGEISLLDTRSDEEIDTSWEGLRIADVIKMSVTAK
jgi:hypothetical protein